MTFFRGKFNKSSHANFHLMKAIGWNIVNKEKCCIILLFTSPGEDKYIILIGFDTPTSKWNMKMNKFCVSGRASKLHNLMYESKITFWCFKMWMSYCRDIKYTIFITWHTLISFFYHMIYLDKFIEITWPTLITLSDPLNIIFLAAVSVHTGLSWASISSTFSNVSIFQTYEKHW